MLCLGYSHMRAELIDELDTARRWTNLQLVLVLRAREMKWGRFSSFGKQLHTLHPTCLFDLFLGHHDLIVERRTKAQTFGAFIEESLCFIILMHHDLILARVSIFFLQLEWHWSATMRRKLIQWNWQLRACRSQLRWRQLARERS